MNTLTKENIDFIYQDIQLQGLNLDGLLDEMVDHICCSIEPVMDAGISFETAYTDLMDTIEKSTFKNVQYQTLLSTNLKFQSMKKLMIVSGTLSAFFLTAGSILKFFHMSPASALLLLGTLIAVFGFFPLFFYTSYKEQLEKKSVLLSLVGYLTISSIMVGVLFRVNHWPGAEKTLLVGELLLLLLFLPLYLVNAYKRANELKTNFGYVLIIVLIGVGIISMWSVTGVSRQAIERFDTINNNAASVSQVFEQKNDSILKILRTKESYTGRIPGIEETESMGANLISQIEAIKNELKEITKSNSVNDIKNKGNLKAFRKVMLKDNNAYKLEDGFFNYKAVVLEMAENEYQKETLGVLLDFEMLTESMYEQGFKSTSLIAGMALLSGMQRNIHIANYEILSSIK